MATMTTLAVFQTDPSPFTPQSLSKTVAETTLTWLRIAFWQYPFNLYQQELEAIIMFNADHILHLWNAITKWSPITLFMSFPFS